MNTKILELRTLSSLYESKFSLKIYSYILESYGTLLKGIVMYTHLFIYMYFFINVVVYIIKEYTCVCVDIYI